jgi:hypothetical protein
MGSTIKKRLKTGTKLAEFAPESPPPKPSHPSVKSAADEARAKLEQPSDDDDPAADVLLRSPAVRQRYCCSDMWIHRRLNDASGFPKPLYIAGLRHWHLHDLLAWERAQAKRPVPKPRILEQHDAALEALAEKRTEQKRRKAEQAAAAAE